MQASLRVRLAVVVAAVSLLALGGAGATMVWVVTNRMHDSARSEALRALDRTRAQMASGHIDMGERDALGEPNVAISLGQNGEQPSQMPDLLTGLEPGEERVARADYGGAPAYVAATILTAPSGGKVSIIAAAPLAQTERTLSVLRTATAIAVPTLAMLFGLLAAVVADRALRPVAAMRADADAISHGTLHRRLTPVARTRELADLATTMNDMLDRLDQAATRQRQFVSDVSHELRSPLATVRATLEVALADPTALPIGGPAALKQVDRLDTLVRDLLALSRLDESAAWPTVEVDLDDIVLGQAATVRRPELRVDTSAVAAARVPGDRPTLEGMVRNLLDNAARHATSTVAVGLHQRDRTAVLTVDDDGPGVPAPDRDRIFGRFARLDEARTRDVGGAGLGLAIVAATTHAHHGAVTVTDAPIGGARFVVTLPTAP